MARSPRKDHAQHDRPHGHGSPGKPAHEGHAHADAAHTHREGPSRAHGGSAQDEPAHEAPPGAAPPREIPRRDSAAPPGLQEHRAHSQAGLACAVITVSDTRTPETDRSGQLIRQHLEHAGHRVSEYHIIKDEPSQIRPLLERLLSSPVQAVIINGGTGVARRDVTFDAIQGLLEKELPGFGELFRALSYAQIGSAALLSRATAGTARGKVVFSVPGSSGAVQLAMERLILPELPHIVAELTK